jgi:membrane fusion protein (multidrug efflux system)
MTNKTAPKVTATAALMITALIWGACSAPAVKKDFVQHEQSHIETFAIRRGGLESGLNIPGELIANREVDLYAKVNSYVKSLNADVGSQVRSGVLLATLEAPELDAQLASAGSRLKAQEANYLSSNATYQRILETSKTPGTVSRNDVDVARAKRDADLAQLQAAKADLRGYGSITQYLSIRAPFDGVISARNVNLGAYVGPTGKGSDLPIFTLQEQKHLRLVVSVPEAYVNYIRLNDTVTFTIKAFPAQIFKAKISRRAGVMDKGLRSERIEMDVPNEDVRLSPGMAAEATISLSGEAQAFVVPRGAVLNSSEGVYLIRNINGRAFKMPVVKGRENDSLIEVFGKDLSEGSIYVLKASEEIHDNTKIN